MRHGAGFQLSVLSAVMLTGLALPSLAQEAEGPGPGVARVSIVNGDVSVRRGDAGEWVAAAPNAPLLAQDTIATGPGGRAEVQFDSANLVRLAPETEVRFTDLGNGRSQMEVARGTVEFRVLRDSNSDNEVDTPAASVRPSKRGSYRISVTEDGQAIITARSGDTEVYTPKGVEYVQPGRTMMVRNGNDGPEFQMIAPPQYDEFDRWNDERDRTLESSTSYRYVSPSIPGAEDLDPYGRWVQDPSYGTVWAPNVAADWAPYTQGRWAWEDYYGWTWVSYDPWGWAPYHYGRWYHGPVGWCWYPGPIYSRHYWRPALVAFFGFGGGGGFGFGFGNIGWVPLAPYEPFYPWYGRGYYGRGFNYTNVNVFNVYRNARVPHAIGGMAAGAFGRGGYNVGRFSGADIRQAGLVRGQLPFTPSRESLRFANREVRSIPRSNISNMRFYSVRQPAPSQRTAFGGSARSGGFGQPANRAPAAAYGGNPGASGGGWRRFGEPSGAQQRGAYGAYSRGNAAAPPAGNWQRSAPGSSGYAQPGGGRTWQRFGEPSAQPYGRSYNGNGASPGYGRAPAQSFGRSAAPESMRISPPVVRERSAPGRGYSSPSYNAPRSYSAPRMESAPRSYSAPRMESAPRSYSAPRMESAPRSYGGGGGMRSAPSGGGGSRSYGGGGGGFRGGGGGGRSGGGGSHGGGRR